MTASGQKSKKSEFVKAILDLFILGLLLAGSGLGGYWYGMHERVVPVELVPNGTPGAVSEAQLADKSENKNNSVLQKARNIKTGSTDKPAASSGKTKYWLTSSGTEYIGYSITVSINGDQVDGFFAPGKIVDITSRVKKGDNTILFEAKQLGEDYNKHKGDAQAKLAVKLVSGPKISEDSKNVTAVYERNASEQTDFQETKHFQVK